MHSLIMRPHLPNQHLVVGRTMPWAFRFRSRPSRRVAASTAREFLLTFGATGVLFWSTKTRQRTRDQNQFGFCLCFFLKATVRDWRFHVYWRDCDDGSYTRSRWFLNHGRCMGVVSSFSGRAWAMFRDAWTVSFGCQRRHPRQDSFQRRGCGFLEVK